MEKNCKASLLFQLEDIYSLKEIHSISISPDENSLVCAITEVVNAGAESLDKILFINLQTKKQKILAKGIQPSWSPNGKQVAFLNTEYGNRTLWVYDFITKRKVKLVEIHDSDYFLGHLTDKNFSWSPNGEYIAYICVDPESQKNNLREGGVRVFSNLLYKTKGGRVRPLYSDHCYTRLWYISLSRGEPVKLTSGPFNDHSLDWSPDGEYIVFVSDRSSNPDYTSQDNLWIVHKGTKEVNQLIDSPYPGRLHS